MLRENIWRGDARLKHQQRGDFIAGLTLALVGENDPENPMIVTMVRDVSEIKQLEDLKNRFIASAAHELRNPVMNFNLRMFRIKKQQHVTEEDIEVLDRVVKRMNRLVNNLLDLEQLERRSLTLSQEPLILQEIIQDVITIQSTYAQEQTIALRNNMPEKAIYILADAIRLEQVFTNLIANAIAYTATGGTITVCAEADEAQQHVNIQVCDTGIGIPPEKISEIFQPFTRLGDKRKSIGSGLGLSIAHEIVTLHEGSIHVESEVDKGSCFIVTLPVMTVDPE